MSTTRKTTPPLMFQAELLHELLTMVDSGGPTTESAQDVIMVERAASGDGPRRPRRRAYGLAAAGLTAVSLGIVGAVAMDGSTAQAAPFTVAPQPDGTVRFAIHEYRDPAGLQAQLRAAGVNAVVDYLSPGLRCADSRFTPYTTSGGNAQPEVLDWVPTPDRRLTDDEIAYYRQGWQQIHPDRIPTGATLVLTQSIVEDGQARAATGSAQLAAGEVRPCNPIADPTAPRPAVSNGAPVVEAGEPPAEPTR